MFSFFILNSHFNLRDLIRDPVALAYGFGTVVLTAALIQDATTGSFLLGDLWAAVSGSNF